MSLNFFRKCGASPVLLPLILALFCIAGCIGNGGQENYQYQDYQSSSNPAENDSPLHLEVDLYPEVSSQVFRAYGSLTLQGSRTLPYLVLNATLQKDGRPLKSTRYMMIEVEPNKEYAFEISKSMRLMPGGYRCSLEALGPEGQLAVEDRECRIVEPIPVEPLPEPIEPMLEPPSGPSSSPRSGTSSGTLSSPTLSPLVDSQPVTEMEKPPQTEEEPHEVSSTLKEISENAKEAEESSVDSSEERPSLEMASGSDDNESDIRANPEMATVQENAFVGSTSSTKYHRPSCRYAVKIRPENRIYFASAEAAENKGYKPCKACNPGP